MSTANNSYFDVIPKVDNPVLINVDNTTTILKSGRGKDKKPRKRRTKAELQALKNNLNETTD